MSLLTSLSKGTYQKGSQVASNVGDKIKRAYVPDTMSSMYGAGMFGQLLQSIRDTAKSTKKDSDKTQKIMEKGYVDTRTLYLDMLKKLDSIDKSLKYNQKQNATTIQSAGGDYTTGNNQSSMGAQKGGGDMLTSLLDFAKGNPLTTLMGVGGLGSLIYKAVQGALGGSGAGGGQGGGGSSNSDYSGPGLRNNPVTDLITDVGTAYAGYKVAKFGIGKSISLGMQGLQQKRAGLSALEAAKDAGMFGLQGTQTLGAPTMVAGSQTSLGTDFESAYAKNRAAGMSPADAKRAAGLEVRGTNFGQLAAKEAAMKPTIAATPSIGEKAASFGSKALEVGGTAVKWGGRALGALGVGFSAYDAYQKNKEGDTVGTWLSGASAATGAVGLGLAATGVGVVPGAVLMGTSAVLGGIGAARDWIRGPKPDAEAVDKPTPAASTDGDSNKPIKRVISAAPGLLSVEYEDGSTATRRGNRNVRNNNPGNLEASSWTQTQPGFIGSDGRFAIFKTQQDGEKALEALLKGSKYNQLNLQQAISKYAPSSENDTRAYIQRLTGMGLDPNKRIAEYSPTELATLRSGITKVEGGGGVTSSTLASVASVGGDLKTGDVSDVGIGDVFGRNAGALASSEIAKLTGFLREGFENIGNANYNVDNSVRISGGAPAQQSRPAPNATRTG